MGSRQQTKTSPNLQPTSRYGPTARYTAYNEAEERKLFAAGEYWELITNASPWLRYVCSRWTVEYLDDLHTEVLIQCYNHIESFNPDKGRFSTWATWQVRNLAPRFLDRMNNTIYVPNKPRFRRPVVTPWETDVGKENDEPEIWLTDKLKRKVVECVQLMCGKWVVIWVCKCHGYNNEKIGKIFKITRSRVQQIEQLIIKQIREVLCQEYEDTSLDK